MTPSVLLSSSKLDFSTHGGDFLLFQCADAVAVSTIGARSAERDGEVKMKNPRTRI